ncbi:MAG: hypothetical protein FWC20_11970 [Oscillospiraceae bacterium]|nr:hypothetical protein [Oscillospiraceae bacterium]MCL2280101.1 hypothetical protein [Oscillospiraceae bacterium]
MTIKEKISYLKGLAEGMDAQSNELGKLVVVIIDTLVDMADEIEELNENALDLAEELDELSDDLADVELVLEELEDELDFDSYDDFDSDDDDMYNYSDDDDDDEDGMCCDMCGEQGLSVDIACPKCGTEIELDELDIENEAVTCPDCKENIELEIDVVETNDDF